MERVEDVVKVLKGLDEKKQRETKNGVDCAVAMSDDYSIKVAVVKTEKPRVYEIIQFEKIDDIMFKERIVKRVQMYGRRNTADLVCRIVNKEVRL